VTTGGPADDVRRPSGSSGSRARLSRGVRDVRVQVAAGVAAALTVGMLVGALVFGGGEPAPAAAPPAPTPRPTSSAPAAVPTEPVPTGPVAAEADAPAPVAIRIPDLSIDQAMVPLGVTPERKLEVPEEWMDIGWWKTGPAPGEAGGAVIAGHVNGDGKPAVFVDLPSLAVGAQVEVQREDGSVATFVVRSKEQFPKDDFPNERMYTFEGPSFLHLVTCGGSFDTRSGHYDDNIVVFAELVGVASA